MAASEPCASATQATASSSAVIQGTCETCKLGPYRFHHEFVDNDDKALDFLRTHGVLPRGVQCPHCGKACTLDRINHRWRCRSSFTVRATKVSKKRRVQCTYTVSDYKGTFLERSCSSPWQILVFTNQFLLKSWSHEMAMHATDISLNTSIDWRSFCSEVTLAWLEEQEPIGGVGKQVEIDETFFCKRKHNVGRGLSKIWVFGGIERNSDRFFLVPLVDEHEGRSAAVLVPLIKKFILPGTTVISDCWRSYSKLCDEGFEHWTVNHSVNFVDPSNPEIHTQHVERLWLDFKQWTKRPGLSRKYMRQYVARYLFSRRTGENRQHEFLRAAGRLYPHISQRPDGIKTIMTKNN